MSPADHLTVVNKESIPHVAYMVPKTGKQSYTLHTSTCRATKQILNVPYVQISLLVYLHGWWPTVGVTTAEATKAWWRTFLLRKWLRPRKTLQTTRSKAQVLNLCRIFFSDRFWAQKQVPIANKHSRFGGNMIWIVHNSASMSFSVTKAILSVLQGGLERHKTQHWGINIEPSLKVRPWRWPLLRWQEEQHVLCFGRWFF